MTKCPRFSRCEEHWTAEELKEMKPIKAEEKQPTEEVQEMKRSAFGRMMVVSLVLMMLGGCAGLIDPATKTTTTTTDRATGNVTVTETSPQSGPGFFASENLLGFFDYKKSNFHDFASLASKKLDSINEAGAELRKHCKTELELALAANNQMMAAAAVPTSPAPDGVAAPHTMVDFSWNGLLNTGLGGLNLFLGQRGNTAESTSMNIKTGDNAPVFVGSNGNNIQKYDLQANGDAGYISGITFGEGVTYTPQTTTTTSEQKSYGLTF
jgi:hypothetical protein